LEAEPPGIASSGAIWEQETRDLKREVIMQQDSVIIVKNLNYYFGHHWLRKQILFDINFSIESGEIVILTGLSGSVKQPY
jgi:ABC-type multidrug transport system fused ATPase/permease subunit